MHDGAEWKRYVLYYNSHHDVKQVRTWTSPDGNDWVYTSNSLMTYDGQYRLTSRIDYAITSDTDSVIASSINNDYTSTDAQLISQYSDMSGNSYTEKHYFATPDSSITDITWTNAPTTQRQTTIYYYTRDTLNRVDMILTGNSDTLMGYRYFTTYSKPHITCTTIQTYSDGKWLDSLVNKQWHDSNNRILSEIQYHILDTILTPLTKATYHYNDNGHLESTTLYSWTQQFWQTDSRTQNNITDTGTTIESTYQAYENNEWHSHATTEYTYNALGQIESFTTTPDFWSTDDLLSPLRYTTLPENLTKRHIFASQASFTYISSESTNIDPDPDDSNDSSQLFIAYPNPSNTGLFRFDLKLTDDAQCYIYNTCGNMIYHNTQTTNLIDLSHLPTGLYIAIIYNDGKKHSAKLMIAK